MAIEQLSDKKISNVIGAPFSPFVLTQLGIRVANSNTLSRTQNQVMFLANKTAWARLTSSVNIIFPSNAIQNLRTFYENLELDPDEYLLKNALAKSWVLEAGTSIQSEDGTGINLRQGIGRNGAYGLGGTEELGYRPMPGLTSVQVQTTGTLGSLKQATVSFKVWNMNQLNIIEALYFRLGYSMLLEWGHVQYFQNNGTFKKDEIFGIEDPFGEGKRKEQVQQQIAAKVKQTNGNYDGMLGVVSNFNWSFNQSGGYDCTLRLIGLGAIMDSLRVDQSYALPPGLVKRFKKDLSLIEAAEAPPPPSRTPPSTPAPPLVPENSPTKFQEAYVIAQKYDINFPATGPLADFKRDYAIVRTNAQKPAELLDQQAVYFNLQTPTSPGKVSVETVAEAQRKFNGLWVFYGNRSVRLQPTLKTTLDIDVISGLAKLGIDQTPNIYRQPPNNGGTYIYDNPVSKVYQSRIAALDPGFLGGGSIIADLNSEVDVTKKNVFTITNIASGTGSDISRFNLEFEFVAVPPSVDWAITYRAVLDRLQKLLTQRTVEATIKSISARSSVFKTADVVVEFELDIDTVPALNSSVTGTKPGKVIFTLKTNDVTAFANTPRSVNLNPPSSPPVAAANTGDTSGNVNKESTEQVDAAKGFQSALHAMLTVVKARLQADTSTRNKNVAGVSILEITREFYNSGIFKSILTLDPTKKTITIAQAANVGTEGIPFDVTKYALKGFNSELMIDPTKYDQVLNVDFKKLCTAFIIRYPKVLANESESTIQVPVYISLGYLLAFLNNMCLIYDSTTEQQPNQPQTGEQRPYFYIDFNPETNFCLTSPQQFSIDPNVCIIPLEASPEEYQAVFPEDVKITTKNGEIVFNDKNNTRLFNPAKENGISAELIKNGVEYRKTGYQGRLMNILLNIDYLLNLASSFQTSDTEHAVNLQPFLERIMVDINKCFGNMNLFRVAYRDESNTIQIVDSQWAPNLATENSILKKGTIDPDTRTLSGIIPVFDNGSLAREFQLKTTISTKLASVIAISAQAATGSVNSKDHSSFSWLNQNFQDRYKQYIQDPSNGDSGASNAATKDKRDSNEVKAAVLFNSHVKNTYSGDIIAAIGEKIELSKNYYIERISKVKSSDPITVSAPFIPADLEITIDGISGIIMGNAFLIPEERLPLTLRGENGTPKVGFIVTNLSNTIENNQWLTKFRGQMIKLRDFDGFKKLSQVTGTVGKPRATSEGGGSGGGSGLYPGACNGPKVFYNASSKQVLAPESVNSGNFSTRYYPGYVFRKGISDIDLASFGLTPLTEAGIVDDTPKNRFLLGSLRSPVPYFVIHHTGRLRTPEDVYRTFYCRGYPAQYVIAKDGQIHRFMPDGALAYHALNFNSVSMGVEIIGANDDDILPVQTDAAIRLAQYLGFKIANIVGHGKVTESKEDTEGYSTVRRLNPNYQPLFDAAFVRNAYR